MGVPWMFLYILLFSFCYAGANQRTVKVAVYEHNVTLPTIVQNVVTRQQALSNMMVNLEVMKARTEEASLQGAKLIVLPEYGIYGPAKLGGLDKTKLIPYLEHIPDPKTMSWNPCDNPDRFADADVQIFLSCLAKNNSIYVVANYGDIQRCQTDRNPECPPSGHLQFNTNIVYDNHGNFIAKYHKFNLFYEFHFDTPKQADITSFQTPFGTFGVFTCFDILYHDPVIELIEKQGIRNIVFPTAWMDELPFFVSVQFHSAFDIGSGINFLVSNIHLPSHKFHGSGIYTPNGTAKYYYNIRTNEGRLLVADIPIIEKFSKTQKTAATTTNKIVSSSNEQTYFSTPLFHDHFNMVSINSLSGNISVCHNKLCCHLSYKRSSQDEHFAFGVFDGLHTYSGNYYLQICVLLKCRDSNRESCSTFTNNSTTYFKDIEMKGNFSGAHIYPKVLLSKDGQLTLTSFRKRQHNHNALALNGTSEFLMLSGSLFSRLYGRDTALATQPQTLLLG